jgi:hypothetical protein
MHIIFGKDEARALQDKYTVLELDTFRFEHNDLTVPAYCIIENIGIGDLPDLERMKNLHAELIKNYKIKNWEFCLQALEHLSGKWGGEVDSFYADIGTRVNTHIQHPPAAEWNPNILKTTS